MRNFKDNSYRVLGKDFNQSENSFDTGLNNNILVTGISGCGKTGSYVIPNLYSTAGSIVVADTKSQLFKKHSKNLKKRGYKTLLLDFVNPELSCGFNPLKAIERRTEMIDGKPVKKYRQQDVMSIATLMVPKGLDDEPFWEDSARQVVLSLIAYVLEVLPEEEQHMGSVNALYREMCREIGTSDDFKDVSFFKALGEKDPESFAFKKYCMYAVNFKAEKCWSSISMFVSNALAVYDIDENAKMLCTSGFDLTDIGKKKTAVFVNISDVDRSMDSIVNIFYTQLFQKLIRNADSRDNGRLPVPVHIILDDFASNVFIPDFDKILSVIRSRDISASIILQSLSQLEGMYKNGRASTIINNCDTMLYMGGQDVDTARFFADKAGKLPENILAMDLDHEWIFMRGKKARLVEKVKPYSMGPADFEV